MSRRLLLVDDDPVDLSLVAVALEDDGVEVTRCKNGDEALTYLQLNGPGTPNAPAVVFLDLIMPKVNGFEVLSALQSQLHAYRIPIVVFTSSRGDADIYLGYKLGANAFVIKPHGLSRLREVAQLTARFWLNSNVLPPN